jgi:BMFP domain-containing protein YqiC
MQTRNKVLDDLSQLMTNAMGVAQGAREEAETAMKSMIDRWLADRDFVTREEFDAVRAMAQKAREENEALKARIEALDDETLRMICTFEMEPPQDQAARALRGAEPHQRQLLGRRLQLLARAAADGLPLRALLAGGQMAGPEQIDCMIASAVRAAERYYPAFQLVAWAGREPEEAMQVAIAEAYGRA